MPIRLRDAIFALSPLLLLTAMTGCGIGTPAGPVGSNIQSVQGTVHGGQSPIQGSTVKLYHTDPAATAYGAPGIFIGSAVTDINGSFAIASSSFSGTGSSATSTNCPAGTQAYITAAGGYQPGLSTTVNNNLLMVAALGDCANVSSATTVIINELTTVAAAYALSGFTTTAADGSTGYYKANIGAPAANNASTSSITATTPAGLAHAFLNAASLVSSTTGTANSSISANTAGTSTTGSVPSAELNTLADIMQSCVNSTSSSSSLSTSCTSLFGFTPSISGVAPTNTLQAFVYLARNPYPSAAAMSSTSGLITLSAPSPAFQPVLTGPPTDWSVSIVYNSGLALPYWLALDMNDTVFLGLSTTSATTPGLFGLSPYGVSVPTFASPSAFASTKVSRGIAPDALGNIWLTNNSFAADRFSASTGAILSTYTSTLGATYGAAVDTHNNVWFSHVLTVTGSPTTTIDEAALNAGTWAANYTSTTPANTGGYGISVDANQNIWVAGYLTNGTIEDILPNTGTTAAPVYTSSGTSITPTSVTVGTKPYSAVFDSSGNAWVAITGSNTTATTGFQEITGGASSPTAQTQILGTTAGSNGKVLGATAVQMMAIDGAGTIFIPDNNSSSMGIHIYSTTLSNTLSPANGIKSCYLSTSSLATCGATSGAAIYNPRQLAVDSTGSVWSGITSGGVTQVIGVAAPSYPLLSAGKPGLSPGLTAANPLP